MEERACDPIVVRDQESHGDVRLPPRVRPAAASGAGRPSSLHLLHGGLARQADLAGPLVDADALDPDHVAHLDDVLGAAHPEVREFGDVDQAFLAGHALDEAAELLDAGDPALVELAHLDLGAAAAEGVDFLDRAVHGVGVVRVDEHLARVVLGDVDLGAGGLGDAADRLAAGPDEQADLFRIDLDRLDPRGVLREVGARGGQGASIFFRISIRASRAWKTAALAISKGRPLILRSSWKPVIPLVVPASLKSMSPKWSSSPRMSVMVTHFSIEPSAALAVIRPQEMPATGAMIGTPASIRDRQPPQIEAIEVEPLEAMISATTRIE